MDFGATLRRLRDERGLTLRKLANLAHYSAGWLSKVETGTGEPTLELAQACDDALEAGGELVALARARLSGSTQEGVPRPAQLPAGAGAMFVGRERELELLDEHLELAKSAGTVMTVAIDGPAGAGKTALAIRWAHRVAHEFPDGVLFADLRGFVARGKRADPGGVIDGFLTALGVPVDGIPSSIEQRAAMMRSAAAGKRLLVVLDNAASGLQVRPMLLGAQGCAVVITSRRRMTGLVLRDGAARLTIGPMEPAESQAVLTTAIGSQAEDETEAIRALAEQCAHLPLALRVAAEKVAARASYRVADLVGDLATKNLDVLTMDENDFVHEAISSSYRQVDPPAARMFRLLGLHPGPDIDLGAAAALAGQPFTTVQRLMERLEGVHLVEGKARGTWHLYEPLRAYAARCVLEDEPPESRDAAIQRLTTWFLSNPPASE
ncbi:helix-turn-helix domain-containing protein [Streptomyces millisiae]|uniref:Helix-turn-helix domain-containing protein n=1 Tax=Streptomyces millisiae TaxID=3075542 RepID=A0ABU2LV04_9ACTN|nr:helix-turn-helix domain-containing protein [Streptomyces sp. DSM 44918]MDT0321431.1 helix-turn-helix domain-containing protein [Streptomyces sp. DSM 44918]